MNKIYAWGLLAAALLTAHPDYLCSQSQGTVPNQNIRNHHEVPDQPYRAPALHPKTSTPASVKSSNFTMVQVNVDASGQNILGDAANEPSLAINPVDPNLIVIGWRQFDDVSSNFRQAGFGYSWDAGLTWTFPGVIDGGVFRSDPVLDCNDNGAFFYNSLTSNGTDFSCKVFKSTDGGAGWDNGVDARGGDKQWMTIDRTGGIGNGNIYSSWTSYYSICYPGFFTRSTDGGASFDWCTDIPGNPFWGTMTVGNSGELYVCGSGELGGIVVSRSSSAQDPGAAPDFELSTNVFMDGYLTSGVSINPVGLVGQCSIGVDHSDGPGRDNVYVLASVQRFANGDSADVMFAKSTDRGFTWSDPVRINTDVSASNYQWFGTLSVAPNGRIDVIWLDTRDAPPEKPYMSSLYYSHSEDLGETWSANERLTDSFDPHVGYPQQAKMGDYFDMESDETSAHLAWANTFNGEEDVYYSTITPVIDGVHEGAGPDQLYTMNASPNPFSDHSSLNYFIPSDAPVKITLVTIYGQEVLTLADEPQTRGKHTVTFSGAGLPAGYYLCRLQSGSHTKTISLIKVR